MLRQQMDALSVALSRCPANAAVALLEVLGSTTAEALATLSLITHGLRAPMPANGSLIVSTSYI